MKNKILTLIIVISMLAMIIPVSAAETADEIDASLSGGLESTLLDYNFDLYESISSIGGMQQSGAELSEKNGKKYINLSSTGKNARFSVYSDGECLTLESDVMFNSCADFSVFDVKAVKNDGSGEGWAVNSFKSEKYLGKYYFSCYKRTDKRIEAGRTYRLKMAIKQGDNGFVNYYVDGEKIQSQKLSPPTKSVSVVEISTGDSGSISFNNFIVKNHSGKSIFDSEITREPALSERPTQQTIGNDFKMSNVHPRIIADSNDFERIKSEIRTNADKKAWYETMLSKARQLLYAKTLVYELRDGERLMYVSSEFEERMVVLGMAYRLTGDTKYAAKAYEDLEAVANFRDWHPTHHIDTGIMAAGFAIGYDWFYDYFSAAQRAKLEAGIDKNGFKDIILSYQSTSSAMDNAAYVQDNHNAMCNGGAVLAALAFYDVFPDKCKFILSNGIRGFEEMMWRYSPDGAWFEGAMYGAICINYLSMAYSSMEKCLGTLYGLDSARGFDKAYDYIADVQSSVASYNFGDSEYMDRIYCYSGWISNHFGKDTGINLSGSTTGVGGEQLAFAILWNDGNRDYDTPTAKLYNTEGSPLKLLTMRDKGESETYVGIKAGDTVCEHSQLDSGSFVFDSQGVRWACDMGKDDYNLPGFWDTSSGRWKVFLNRAEAHNTVVINPTANLDADYKLGSSAAFEYFEENNSGAVAKIDMSELLSENAESAQRAFCFTDNRKSLVIRDEINVGSNAKELYWLLYTRADMTKLSDNRLLLTDKSSPEKKVIVDYLCSSNGNNISADVVYEDAKEMADRGVDGQSANSGYYRLAFKMNTSGNMAITVKLTPINIDGSSVERYNVPINSWTASIVNSEYEALSYLQDNDNENAQYVLRANFDTRANISNPDYSMINTNNYSYDKFNYSMDKNGRSDVIVVESDETGNRYARLTSNAAASKYESIKEKSELVFCDMDTQKKQGKTVRYDVDLMFPDFLQDKYIFETKYINAQSVTTWFAQECLIVQSCGDDFGVLCVNDNRSEYLAEISKNKWYNFAAEYDFENSEIRFYLDGTLVATRAASSGMSAILKASIKLVASDINSEILIDNYNVCQIPYPTQRLDCYVGDKAARTVVMSDKKMDLYLGTYSNNMLVNVKKTEVGNGLSILDFNLGQNASKVKIMMWERGTMMPACSAREK